MNSEHAEAIKLQNEQGIEIAGQPIIDDEMVSYISAYKYLHPGRVSEMGVSGIRVSDTLGYCVMMEIPTEDYDIMLYCVHMMDSAYMDVLAERRRASEAERSSGRTR